MGEEYTYNCRNCKFSQSLIIGNYGCKGWGDRETLADIKDRKYGVKARKALEEHPGCLFHFQTDVFSCGCGYTKSYDSLVIHSKAIHPEIYFFTEHRCPRCRKKMERMIDFPTDYMCPKCGGKMMMDCRSFMRW
jgi:DNA-directed RNA polymerase subunit RPC12/RpoP